MGILSLAGTVVGGVFGGPIGATAGKAIGGALEGSSEKKKPKEEKESSEIGTALNGKGKTEVKELLAVVENLLENYEEEQPLKSNSGSIFS